ncbi:XH/XS domain-containing protein [Trifolium repens]|nr:XH/XS domain-containing protein [Trifolium repens]
MFVWPWTVILANNARIKNSKTGKYVRKNEQEINEKLRSKGYEFSEILLFSNNREQTEFEIVIFGKESLADFTNAMKLEDAFKSKNRGKENYFERKKDHDLGDQLYGWMAGSRRSALQIQPSTHRVDLLDHDFSFS